MGLQVATRPTKQALTLKALAGFVRAVGHIEHVGRASPRDPAGRGYDSAHPRIQHHSCRNASIGSICAAQRATVLSRLVSTLVVLARV